MATTPTPEELALHVTVEQALHLINTLLPKSFKAVEFEDNTLKFWKNENATGDPDKEITIVDRYLDQHKTGIVRNFEWSATTYPGTEDPELDGKDVLVFAVKGENNAVSYSFASISAVLSDAIANKADKLGEDDRKEDQILLDDGNGNIKKSGKTITEIFREHTATMAQFCNALNIPEPTPPSGNGG